MGDAQVILLVDDQEMTLTVAGAALKNAGYDVYKASNGTEGLRIAAQLRPDLIVTDILLPRMGGVELFNALQANSDLASLPVIALTAKSSPEFEAQLLDMVFYDFIAKPISAVRLVARVKRVLKYNSK